ncbi:uncharacterized protein LOC124355359 [Homalodisca vitripennis]|uniref:uncharacterized protein LOC124355359 n=1 Tax=Homalodisca vitripennis TaxID=197043 RepID=UPI001EEBE76E|nr:uncharacterized protein LOC124355359 [Homalodisca vitripennis]KAG8312671.1 hypothetical protein J6590_018311 [Homalodisca vitripennis]
MELKFARVQYKLTRLLSVAGVTQLRSISPFHSSTDTFVDNLIFEEGRKREISLFKYFENKSFNVLFPQRSSIQPNIGNKFLFDASNNNSIQDLVTGIENYLKGEISVPNKKLNFLLIYFAKNGNTTGVEAVQVFIKRHNFEHFQLQSEYKHYLAEALFIRGKVEDSLLLFFSAYNNVKVRDKVKLKLVCLFPLLSSQHSDGRLRKTIKTVEQFSLEQKDQIILGYLWKSLFESTWFSDHQLAEQILEKHPNLVQVIKWMIPAMGKELLQDHKIDDFYRLIELTLKYELKRFEGTLLQFLFDYYYIHQNIERCSEVVKYLSTKPDFQLSEDQQRKYINLLLKRKDSVTSKLNIKKPQNLKYKF